MILYIEMESFKRAKTVYEPREQERMNENLVSFKETVGAELKHTR